MPFDNMNDFIDVHDTSSTRRDEEERQNCLENAADIVEAARKVVKVIGEHREGKWLKAFPNNDASVRRLHAEKDVREHNRLNSD